MDTKSFKDRLMTSALELVAFKGWSQVSIIEAAREADLSVARAREHFPVKSAILLHLNACVDEKALEIDIADEQPREALFDLFMARFDVLQKYRAAIISILYAIPRDPALAVLLGGITAESMRWIGQAAGIDVSTTLKGFIHTNQLVAIWTQAVRHWAKDSSADMTSTMAELDKILSKSNYFGLYPTGSDKTAENFDTAVSPL